VLLLAAGAGLVAVATVIGGVNAGVGGIAALVAQTAAVAVLRPAMTAPQPAFMSRWLAGMGIRAAVLAGVIVLGVSHRPALLPATLGYLGVLLPLLFSETRFLR